MARDEINYDYFKSKILDQEYCVHKETGENIFKDGTRYNQEEIKLLNIMNKNPEIKPGVKVETIKAIHLLKKTFKGVLTNNEIEKELRKIQNK